MGLIDQGQTCHYISIAYLGLTDNRFGRFLGRIEPQYIVVKKPKNGLKLLYRGLSGGIYMALGRVGRQGEFRLYRRQLTCNR